LTVQTREHQKTPLWRNATFLKWLAQIVALVAVVAIFVVLGTQAFKNFNKSGISFGWKWLSDPTGVDIREGIDTSPNSGIRALAVGMVNTLRVAVSGVVVATILGTIVGIGRLSKNWIVSKISTVYIETIRNVPLLLQIFFWSAFAIALPSLTRDDVREYLFKASNRGFALAWLRPDGGFWPWLLFVVAGIVVGRFVARRLRQRQEETGQTTYPLSSWLLIVVVLAVAGWFLWPLLRVLAPLWFGIARVFGAVPPLVYPVLVAVGSVAASVWWIRGFFAARRTPAGFGKLTDDDWFRVVFAGISGLAVAAAAFVIGAFVLQVPGGAHESIAELAGVGFVRVFEWLGRSFDLTSGSPVIFTKAAVIVRGAGFVNYGTGGVVMSIPFFAVWTGVTIYTAAFIAEIVRAGILAVPKGQSEAASALGLRRSQLLRFVVLPQAFRIMLPPLGNQYLNLTKNTTLGIAVAFPEIVAVGTTLINQTGQSLPVVLVWMGFFVTLSLGTSAIVNYYNRKLKLVER